MRIIIKLILSALILILIVGCDKKGNPLPSDIMFTAQLNGIKYKDVMPMVIPPGAKRTPVLEIVYGDKNYFKINSFLEPESPEDKNAFFLNIRVPLSEQIVLNKIYSFSPIDGKEKVTGLEDQIYREGNKQFVSITSRYNLDTHYYGKGTLILTEYDLEKNKAKGKVDFVLPYDIWDSESKDLKLTGEFYCWINNPN